MTPGKNTTEFWMTIATNIIGAVLAVLGAYGLLTGSEQSVWMQLFSAVIAAVGPILAAAQTARYTNGRNMLKMQNMENGNGPH